MSDTISDILKLVEENDVKFIRLAYCDLFGVQKNMAVMSSQLRRAFEEGIPFDASAVRGFNNIEKSDLFLVPDPSTVSILPWRPAHERVMRMCCNIKNPDGTDFKNYTRNILKNAVQKSADMGYICNIGTECEFHLFKTDELGEPTLIPVDKGGYNDIAPLDKVENLRREICLSIEKMGLLPESSHHERGEGQNEIDFRYSDALSAADNFLTFKTTVKAIAALNGLYASFLPKPFTDKSGNGLHINLSLSKGDRNLFKSGNEHSKTAESFIAGVLEHIEEITVFLNPITNSYSRFGLFEAPKYITWSHQNRAQLIRIPASKSENTRMQLRSPDSACNPYLAFALIIYAGLDGIEKGMELCLPYNSDLLGISDGSIKSLPENLGDALKISENSSFLRSVLPDEILKKYFTEKESEWDEFIRSGSTHAFEIKKYFDIL